MIKKFLTVLFIFIINVSCVFAVNAPQKYKTLDDFNASMEKFRNSNVSIAYVELENIVKESPEDNDYINIVLAGKLSDIGFYNLADKAKLKIKDKEIAQIPLKNIDVIFHQNQKIDVDDEIYLGECFADITYNNLSKEIATELTANKELLEKYDYALYLASLAWYKNNNIAMAEKYLVEATTKNPQNILYRFLQAKILADKGYKEKALKVAASINKEIILTDFYSKKYNEVYEYILFKTTKEENLKNYHLAYYYYYREDYLRSLKVMPLANSKNKKDNADIYTLISKDYVALRDYEKAFENAQKAYKLNKNNTDTIIMMGDLEYKKNNLKNALKYYKYAMKDEKSKYTASIKAAKIYLNTDKKNKAQAILEGILKTSSNYYEAYYLEALIDKNKRLDYLKRAVSLNSEFIAGWQELAKYELEHGNLYKAQIYLNNAYNID